MGISNPNGVHIKRSGTTHPVVLITQSEQFLTGCMFDQRLKDCRWLCFTTVVFLPTQDRSIWQTCLDRKQSKLDNYYLQSVARDRQDAALATVTADVRAIFLLHYCSEASIKTVHHRWNQPVLSQPQTFNASTPFFAAANAVDSARRDYRTSATSWRSSTTDSSVESAVTSNTSYTGFFRHLLALHKTTICDPVDMTDSYQLTLVILWTANLLLAFCTNTLISIFTLFYVRFIVSSALCIWRHVRYVTA